MSTVILSGTTLLEYVQQARNVCGPDFPIIGLNRQYHIEPSKTFNSLPHTEVDSAAVEIFSLFCLFQLTTSHRGRRCEHLHTVNPCLFQLTTSHRGRRSRMLLFSVKSDFNSLPHTEVDCPFSHFYFLLKLFQLTTSHRGRRLTDIC